MAQRTPLYDWHAAHGARMVDFAGWDMPVQYTTIIEEHQAVRGGCGLFDISHMGRLSFGGSEALALIQQVFTNNAATMKDGQARYGLICNEKGGIRDDVGRFVFQAHDYGFLLAGISNSDSHPPYKSEDNRGEWWTNDLWVVRTYCAFPPPLLEDQPKTCLDDVLTLDATIPMPCPNCTYFWDDGTAGAIRNVSPDSTTLYAVTVVHPDGCEMADSVIIEIVPVPTGFVVTTAANYAWEHYEETLLHALPVDPTVPAR